MFCLILFVCLLFVFGGCRLNSADNSQNSVQMYSELLSSTMLMIFFSVLECKSCCNLLQISDTLCHFKVFRSRSVNRVEPKHVL